MNRGFSLIELIIIIGIIGVISAAIILFLNPFEIIKNARYNRAVTELEQIGKAVRMIEANGSDFPDDVARGVMPDGLNKYLQSWPTGPFEGSVYDYDNWEDDECIDPEADGTIQITLRQVPGYNPDGGDTWAFYYVIRGNGTPHCNNANEWNLGQCVNCQ